MPGFALTGCGRGLCPPAVRSSAQRELLQPGRSGQPAGKDSAAGRAHLCHLPLNDTGPSAALTGPRHAPARGEEEEEGEAALTCSRCSSRKPLLTELHLPPAGEGGREGSQPSRCRPPQLPLSVTAAPPPALPSGAAASRPPCLQTAPGGGKRDPPPAAASFP